MYKKIAVFLDGSENSETVLPYMEFLTKTLKCEINIVGVCAGNEPALIRPFKIYIDDMTKKLVYRGLKVSSVLFIENAVDSAIKYGNESDVDMLAMSTYGDSGLRGWVLGNIAGKALVKSIKPILFVSEKRLHLMVDDLPVIKNILVPLDGSATGASALPWAKELAKSIQARILLLHILVSPRKFIGAFTYTGSYQELLMKTLHTQAKVYLEDVTKQLHKDGIAAEHHIITGLPAEAIIDYSINKSADLIAISTRGHTGINRFLLGSVVNKVVHSTELPILVVRPPKEKLSAIDEAKT